MENSRIAGSVQDAGLPRILDRAAAVLRTTEKPAFILSAAGMGIFMLMVMLTFADVFLRYLFGSSIPGTTELTELLMVIVVFSSVAVTQWQKSHVTMDILTSRLKEPSRALLEVVTGFWSVVIVLFCAWTTFRYGMKTSSVTLVLRIPLEPFICFAGFGFCMLAVALLCGAGLSLRKRSQRSHTADAPEDGDDGRLITLGNLSLSTRDDCFYDDHRERLHLTPMQYALMEMFYLNDAHRLTKPHICRALWPGKDNADETLYTLIRRLKPILESHSNLRISSDRGRAYVLEVCE